MTGPNCNGSQATPESQDTKCAVVQTGVAVVDYDIGAQVRDSYSSWLLCRESAELESLNNSTIR